ncbi:9480_t:CDS:2, partial [Funneliformis mosseae]
MNDKDRNINNGWSYSPSVKEEVNISSYPLTECNDVTNHSIINRHRPKVWAQTRQELCETLNYFRTYQSGVYHKDNVVYSYLMDAFGAKRDVCNGRVIISHGGGKSSKQNNGRYGLFDSQLTTDASVSSLLNNFVDKQPVIIIVGNKCSIVKFQVPARFCVLG